MSRGFESSTWRYGLSSESLPKFAQRESDVGAIGLSIKLRHSKARREAGTLTLNQERLRLE
jgi:hypothetical protein